MKKMTPQEREQYWRDQVRGWHASGKPAAEFAKEGGYSGRTLQYWSRQFRRIEATVGSGPVPTLVRLIPRGSGRGGVGEVEPTRLTVELGGASIHVLPGFDAGLLREVVQALSGGEG